MSLTPVTEIKLVLDGPWLVLAFIVFVVIWVISKVVHLAHKSEQQWRDVDRSKLKEWQDDD